MVYRDTGYKGHAHTVKQTFLNFDLILSASIYTHIYMDNFCIELFPVDLMHDINMTLTEHRQAEMKVKLKY